MPRIGAGWVSALAIVLWASTQPAALAAAPKVTVQPVVLFGQQAPGLPEGFTLALTDAPSMSSDGRIAFRGFLLGENVTLQNRNALWAGTPASLSLVRWGGTPVPEFGPDTVIDSLGLPTIGAGGTIAYDTRFAGTGIDDSNSRAFWYGPVGQESVLAREGMQAPGVELGAQFRFFVKDPLIFPTYPVMSDNGQVAFLAELADAPLDANDGIWTKESGELKLVFRESGPSPGLDAAFVDFLYPGQTLSVSRSGWFGVFGRLELPRPQPTSVDAIWLTRDDQFSLLALSGEAAPGLGGSVTFDRLDVPLIAINERGEAVFSAGIRRPGVEEPIQTIWMGTTGNINLLAEAAQAAPGISENVQFAGFVQHRIGDSGVVAFDGLLKGDGVDSTNDQGIWRGLPGSNSLIARSGDAIEELGENVAFRRLVSVGVLADDSTVFWASYGADDIDGSAIWLSEPDGELQALLKTGDVVDVDQGPGLDERIVHSILSNYYVVQRISPVHYGADIPMHVTFTDGSQGLVLLNVQTVPEPGTLALAACGLLACVVGLGWKRRRRCPA